MLSVSLGNDVEIYAELHSPVEPMTHGRRSGAVKQVILSGNLTTMDLNVDSVLKISSNDLLQLNMRDVLFIPCDLGCVNSLKVLP